jgi:glycerol-3-phosphate acyltransferase PlsY
MLSGTAILTVLGAYLVGSIPTGYMLALCVGVKDIRNHGSGNIGATNVARVLGLHYFLPVFILDVAKATAYLMLIQVYGWSEPFMYLNALLLLVGNGHSIFLQFSGGKGIATATGILFLMSPCLTIFLLGVWLTVCILTQTVGIASATTCLALVISSLFWCSTHEYLSLTLFCIGLWGIWRHTDNIKRYFQLPID